MSSIAVLFGGPSPEHDVSILTGLQAAAVLSTRHDVTCLYWTANGQWWQVPGGIEAETFLGGVPKGSAAVELLPGPDGGFYRAGKLGRKKIALDAAVVACHGGAGEDGRLQGLLGAANVRYTGCGPAASALGMDKLAFGAVVAAAGLPSLPRIAWLGDDTEVPFDGPWLIKPRFGGSSLGIEIVDDLATAAALARSSVALRRGAVLEPYRQDVVDVHVAMRSYKQLQTSLIEKPRTTGGLFDYEQKYLSGGTGLAAAGEVPANLPEHVNTTIVSAARTVAQLVGIRGAVRLDFLLAGQDVYVNELNTIPGALSLKLWEASGTPPLKLLEDLVAEAMDGPASGPDTDAADTGAAARRQLTLGSASTIAAKLA